MKAGGHHYGGQAVLEGVMIRGRRGMAVAVRAPSGEIVLHEERFSRPARRWTRWPFLRGLDILWDTLHLGLRALSFSANVALGESEYQVGPKQMAGVVALALGLAVGLFFLLPMLLMRLIAGLLPTGWLQALVEGFIRLGVVLGYLLAIAQMRDVKRLFAYHGAEHKVVNALEAGAPLHVEGVRPFSTAHTRCGTAFLLLVVVLAIPLFAPLGDLGLGWGILARLALIPVLAGVSYEAMRLGAEYAHRPAVRALLAPALLLQRLSTRAPDDGMLEVALAALLRAREIDAAMEAATEPREI
ncbi:MAG: DUF1385 domain-containing protein [Chloroflexia bacterium]